MKIYLSKYKGDDTNDGTTREAAFKTLARFIYAVCVIPEIDEPIRLHLETKTGEWEEV